MDIETVRRRRTERFASETAVGDADNDPAVPISSQRAKDNDETESSPGSEDNSQSTVIPSEFECVLCLRLYYEPVSLPCGHAFCRHCLKRAVALKPQCPMCRAACHVTAGDAGTNVALVNIIVSRFRREYAARAREEEKDAVAEAETRRRAEALGESVTPAPDGSVSMPVCLLDILLFPHQPVTLYLFESRYITLVNRCLSDTRRFAVFSDSTPASGLAGSILEINDARMVGGGQYLVMCRGVGRCTSVGEFEIEPGTNGLRYARIAPFDDLEEAADDAAAGRDERGGAGATGTRIANEVLGTELRERADRTAAIVSEFIAQLSTRQRNELIRRCGEPPKVGNSSLASYRRLSFWLPSALALNGGVGSSESGAGRGQGGVASGPSVSAPPGGQAASNARDRRAAMFTSRSLKHRLAEACEVVLSSEAVRGSTTRRRERGLRRLFCAHGSGGRSPMLLSSTMNSVLLMVGIIAALWAYQRYSRP